jgi:hypothetical protein
MPDLELASFDEIQAELNRRYPSFVLSVLFVPEGYREGDLPQRITFGGKLGVLSSLGLADASYCAIKAVVLNKIQVVPPNTPLDATS